MPPLKLQSINFAAYEKISADFGISAAVVIPAGARLVATSGHVGIDDEGKLAETPQEQISVAFENVEKSIQAVDPSLTAEEAWASVYQITTYHSGGLGEEMLGHMAKVAKEKMGDRRPAWTAVGVETLVFGSFEIAVFAALK